MMATDVNYRLEKGMDAQEAIGYLAQQLGISNDNPPYYVVQAIMKKVENAESIIGALYEAYTPLKETLEAYESDMLKKA